MTACKFDRDKGDYLIDGDLCRHCADLPARLSVNFHEGQPWDCWTWDAGINTEGYGVISTHNRQHRVHRLMYELRRGAIPSGLVLDHVCRNRACVNPDHLEPVTVAENNLRGISPWAVNARRTVCAQGHDYTPENTRWDRGRRYCLECKRTSTRITARKRRARLRQEASA